MFWLLHTGLIQALPSRVKPSQFFLNKFWNIPLLTLLFIHCCNSYVHLWSACCTQSFPAFTLGWESSACILCLPPSW